MLDGLKRRNVWDLIGIFHDTICSDAEVGILAPAPISQSSRGRFQGDSPKIERWAARLELKYSFFTKTSRTFQEETHKSSYQLAAVPVSCKVCWSSAGKLLIQSTNIISHLILMLFSCSSSHTWLSLLLIIEGRRREFGHWNFTLPFAILSCCVPLWFNRQLNFLMRGSTLCVTPYSHSIQ